jgi:hypothetical protein
LRHHVERREIKSLSHEGVAYPNDAVSNHATFLEDYDVDGFLLFYSSSIANFEVVEIGQSFSASSAEKKLLKPFFLCGLDGTCDVSDEYIAVFRATCKEWLVSFIVI